LNPTVQSVELFPFKGMLAMTIKTSAPLRSRVPLMGTIDDPPKIYFDFPGYSVGLDAANSITERVVSDGLGDVQRVRVGLFQTFPDTTRVVLDLKKPMTAMRQSLPDNTMFAVVIFDPNESGRPTIPPPPGPWNGSLSGFKIVVDAGHGGHDLGAKGARSREKDHTLDIARRLRDKLENRGATVFMTRDNDYFVPLQGRVDFANSRKADIFFSVHINSFRSGSTGTETFYWTAHSYMLAREVQNELVKATQLKSRGISQARFFVIRKTWMPSVLTETCFISNPQEEKLLVDPKWRDRVASGMAQGIVNYFQRYVRPSGDLG
ncbi:MAG: N-acetylmuramoyl-L-alanine amidase, partial [Armatimonadota bacterium]|nr:N-acetylmuramoyl-L-alanine amidase [Armatimonadota bacterium]